MENKLVIKDVIFNFITMFLFSMIIISVEMIYFHQLLIVTNYLKATFVISIALLGLAIGGFLSFYLSRISSNLIMLLSSIGFIVSLGLSYYNIINIGELKYPYFLILPFLFGSVIISIIFAKAESTIIYFTNLTASALGVVLPIILIPIFKSENTIIIISFIPVIFIFLLSFKFKNLFSSILFKIIPIVLFTGLLLFLKNNLYIPDKIDPNIYENKLLPLLKNDYDKKFISRVYRKDMNDNYYKLNCDNYDKLRAKYLLSQLGIIKTYDMNFDIKSHPTLKELYKIYCNDQRILFSEDNLLGRVELLGDDDYMNYSMDGVILDGIDSYNGALFDPRVPHIDNANIFIIGLSADGIVKSCKRLKNAKVSGIEINPIVRKIMEDGKYADFACRPYDNVKVYSGEGRSFLESTDELYDMITLMNIHMEHGPNCTLSPEYFHTIEGTKLLLNKLTDRGYVVYEEIILNPRSKFAFFKFMNTIYAAMKKMNIAEPEKNILVFSWDFWGSNNAFRTVIIKRNPFTEKELIKMDQYLEALLKWYPSLNVEFYPDKNKTVNTELSKYLNNPQRSFNTIYISDNISAYDFNNNIVKNIKRLEDLQYILSKYRYNKNYDRYYLKNISEDEKHGIQKIFDSIDFPYIIDISPTTDDKPFPFNIYVNKKEVKDLLKIILLLSSVLFIPLLFLIVTKIKKYKLNLFVQVIYFSLLGFAYMLVEIVLMQKYQRFIGNPTYSLIITLGGLLFFSGIGSFASRFLPKWINILCFILIPVLLLFNQLFIDSLFLIFAKYSFQSKLIISIIMLFPLTFLMGIPFPQALEKIKKQTSNEYAMLMFGVNGACATIASTLSILISATYGFTTSFIIGILCYLLGAFIFMYIMLKKV